jgi:hypothetical protein
MDGFFGWALAFLIVITLPFAGQVAGYVSYRLLSKRHHSLAHFAGAVIPPAAFFFHLYWLIEPDGFGREGLIVAVGGTALQFLFGLALQLALHNLHKADAGDGEVAA